MKKKHTKSLSPTMQKGPIVKGDRHFHHVASFTGWMSEVSDPLLLPKIRMAWVASGPLTLQTANHGRGKAPFPFKRKVFVGP